MPLDAVHRVESRRQRTTAPRDSQRLRHAELARHLRGPAQAAGQPAPVRADSRQLRGRPALRRHVDGRQQQHWNHYRITVPTLLNLGLSGYALCRRRHRRVRGSPPRRSADALDRARARSTRSTATTLRRARCHQEPWVHGPEHEAIRRRYIEERYRLMPYLYTAIEENSRMACR